MRKKILDTIRKSLYLKKDQISDKSLISEIVRDSMDLIELVAVFVNEYHISVKPSELSKIKTVKDIIEYVDRNKGKSKKASLDSF